MPTLKQGAARADIVTAPEGETYLCLVSFQYGMGSWGRSTDPMEAIKHCATAVREDFKPSEWPVIGTLWKVPDTDLHWSGDQVPKWEGHEDQEVTWWRVLINKDLTHRVDHEYKIAG
jgi:hypothetical protein